MFRFLGQTIARFWPAVLAAWAVLLAATWWCAPAWDAVTETGEIGFLPEDCPSRHSDALLHQAFPGESTGSTIVLAIVRDGTPLQVQDKKFIVEVLGPGLRSATMSESGHGA